MGLFDFLKRPKPAAWPFPKLAQADHEVLNRCLGDLRIIDVVGSHDVPTYTYNGREERAASPSEVFKHDFPLYLIERPQISDCPRLWIFDVFFVLEVLANSKASTIFVVIQPATPSRDETDVGRMEGLLDGMELARALNRLKPLLSNNRGLEDVAFKQILKVYSTNTDHVLMLLRSKYPGGPQTPP